MSEVFVSIWFDTEDYMDPRSDDAALRLASILTDLGAPGTFKMVGEKVRFLERNGRGDVIRAIAQHDVGYHTDWLSRHPMVSEYLVEAGWDDGLRLVLEREGPGVEAVRRVFRRDPSCYGQAGAAWAPQTHAACTRWNIPLYLDEGHHVVVENRPHFYCGVLTVYGLGPANARARLNGPDGLDGSIRAFDRAVEFARESGGGVVNVYYHPWELISARAPDSVNFANGRNPRPGPYELPPPFSPNEIEVNFENFRRYVQYMLSRADVRLVSGREIAQAYGEPAEGDPIDSGRICAAARAFLDEPSYVEVDGRWLSPAELFYLVSGHLAALPARSEFFSLRSKPVLGPKNPPPPATTTGAWLEGKSLLAALAGVHSHMDQQGHVPDSWEVAGEVLPPEALLTSGCRVLLSVVSGGELPNHVGVAYSRLATEKYVAADSEELWRWGIHRPGFRAPRIMEQARLQAWTIKPALRE